MIYKFYFNNKRTGGFLVLTLTLLVSATVLIIATGILLRSLSQVNESADTENSLKAWSTVNACGEYALSQMMASTTSTSTTAANWNFASTTGQSLSVGSQTCYIYPVVASGTDKVVHASSTVSNFTKKISIDLATNTPSLIINSWTEVADF